MARILLVEDDELSRQMLTWRLERRGYHVSVAINGEQALDAIHAEAPSVVLLDMSLPVMDGWEVARRLKANPGTASIPIIALTAHAMRGDRERALEAGCDDYETKPVEFRRLIGKLEAVLGKP